MADTSSSTATGGMLVVLGILIALGVGVFLYKEGMIGKSSEIKINMPKIEAPAAVPSPAQ